AGDDVARRCGRAADEVWPWGLDMHRPTVDRGINSAVAHRLRAGRVSADKVSLDAVVAIVGKAEGAILEPVDDQPSHDRVARCDQQALAVGSLAVDLDNRRPCEAGLGRAVNRYGACYFRKR